MKKDIAIFVNTFLRDDLIYRCVSDCIKYIPNGRLYITDNGRMTDEKYLFYSKLIDDGHIIDVKKEFNYWWRKSFNEKTKIAIEPYILKIDDDFSFDENSKINRLKFWLEKDERLGIIGGQVWHARNNDIAHYIFKITGKRDDKYILEHAKHKDSGYIFCDFIPDFWLARREIFNDVQMENEMQPAQGGHEVFFRKIFEKRMSGEIKWAVGYTNETKCIHEKSSQTEEYKQHRFKGYKEQAYFDNIKVIKPGVRKPNK